MIISRTLVDIPDSANGEQQRQQEIPRREGEPVTDLTARQAPEATQIHEDMSNIDEGDHPFGEDGTPRHCCGAESPITYRYLTFDTPLPPPNTTILAASPPPTTTMTTAAAAAAATSSSSQPRGICPAELDLRPYTDPTLWPAHRKAYHLLLCCLATLLTAYTAGSYSPPVPLMEADFHVSRTAVETGITTFCMGFAFAPMILAPFSEINGRYPVFAVSGVLYVVFQLVCGFAPNLGAMLVARFLTGIGGSVFSTMIGGIIADLWEKEGRNTPMALFSGSVLIGTGLGPLVTAVMTQEFRDDGDKWKWVFWHQVIMGGVLMTLIAFLFKESRGSVVLSRRAKALNKWYEEREQAGYYGVWLKEPLGSDEAGEGSSSDGYDTTTGLEEEMRNDEKRKQDEKTVSASPRPVLGATTSVQLTRLRWRVKSDEERSSLGRMISISVYRPFHLLVTEPVVFSFSLWVSFAWAVLYLTFSSIPYVFETVYGWDIERAGYVFGAMMVGSVLATIIGIWQDELLKHPQWRGTGDGDGDGDGQEWSDASPSDAENNNTSISRRERRARRSGWFYATLRRRFPVEAPESRLYFTCITAVLLPVGLFLFGFTSTASTHWIGPTIAICLATMGIYSIYLATFNYLADVYHIYASSALAAQSFCRNVLGGIFPLVTLPMFENLGIARAGGLLGGIALGLTFVPWVLIFFGPRIRARSAFAVKLEKASPSN